MSIKRLIFLLFSISTLAFIPSHADALVPLLKDSPYFTVTLKPHYVVKTLWLSFEANIAVQIAIDAWNKAAQSQDFISQTEGESDSPVIFITNTELEGFEGLALPFADKVCVIQVVPQYEATPQIYAHEIGHCLGFAHNTKDKNNVMQPYGLRKSLDIDKATTYTLRFLLAGLGV